MKYFKFFLSLVITIGLVYYLNTRLVVSGNPIPPLGKFLDPFGGFWQNAQPLDGETENVTIILTDTSDKVEVIIDNNQVPHIFAKNEQDL